VRVEATPINPSDAGLLLGAADMKTAKLSGTSDAPVVTATIPKSAMKAMAGRLDESMPVGNEGAGVVVDAGAFDAAQLLLRSLRRVLLKSTRRQRRSVPGPSLFLVMR
jgi:hypothetical protein